MPCLWLYLASRNSPKRFCGRLGHPYCPERETEPAAMEQADKEWDKILATHEAVCEEPEEKE